MIDVRLIREEPEKVRKAVVDKGLHCDLDRLIAVDNRRRAIQQEADLLRQQSNELSSQIGLYKNSKGKWYQDALAKGTSPEQLKAEGHKIQAGSASTKHRIKELEEEEKS